MITSIQIIKKAITNRISALKWKIQRRYIYKPHLDGVQQDSWIIIHILLPWDIQKGVYQNLLLVVERLYNGRDFFISL